VLKDHFTKPTQVREGNLTTYLRKLYPELQKGRELQERSNGVVHPETLFTVIYDKVP